MPPDLEPASALASAETLARDIYIRADVQSGPRFIATVAPLLEADRAAVREPLERRVRELEAILLHVNNSLVGHGVLDVEHSIECHADTLPLVARSLHEAIEKAHAPVNEWLHERMFGKETDV